MGLFIRSLLIVLIVKSQVEIQVASSGNQKTVCCEQDTSSKIDELKSITENYLNMVNIELINTNDQVKELKVTMTDNQETVSSEQEDTRRKVDELQVTVSQIHELQIVVSENQETVSSKLGDTRRQVEELQITVSENQETVSSELGDTRRQVEELQVAVSANQETVSSELGETRRQVEELQIAVSGNQETVSSELGDTRRQVEELQVTVSGNQETVSSELGDTRRQVEELQVAVSANQEKVTSEIRGIRRQLEELQVSVSTLVKFLHDTFPMNRTCTAEATERTATTEAVPKDCSVILAGGVSRSGVYTVQPLDSSRAFKVYCDMEADGGGWTVFQRRYDGSVDFFLDFASYSRGFGNLEGEFWLGNDNLHRLTAQGDYELRVELTDFENEFRHAAYDSFSIADVSDNYRLKVGSYSGTAGDSLRGHINYQFTTKDRDNDVSGRNCAQRHHGAWWYVSCGYSNLNGLYLNGTTTGPLQGVVWYRWKGFAYSLKTTEMKIRPTPQ